MELEVIERNVEKLDSVVSCKIVLGQQNSIDEIHIVSNGLRGPKQIARDIQSVLIATYNIPVDYKKISIATILDETVSKNNIRLKLNGISYDNIGSKSTVKISLSKYGETFENTLVGPNTGRNIERMLVEGTLKVVEEACDLEDCFILEDIRTTPVSNDSAVIVVVMGLLNGNEKRFCGSCLVGSDYKTAVVKATLDAVNRIITN